MPRDSVKSRSSVTSRAKRLLAARTRGNLARGSAMVSRRASFPTRMATSPQVIRGFVGRAGDQQYVDATLDQASINTTPTVQHVSIVPQGNTVNSRVGRGFRCQNARIRLQVSADSTAQMNTVRMMLVWDYQPNKALAGFTDIFDAASPVTQPKRENSMRFKIIRDWKFVLLGNSTLATPATRRYLDTYIKLPADANSLLTNADTTGVIGDVIQGALLFCTIGENGTTADAGMTGNIRVNFTEKQS